jgi:hypothetical protein
MNMKYIRVTVFLLIFSFAALCAAGCSGKGSAEMESDTSSAAPVEALTETKADTEADTEADESVSEHGVLVSVNYSCGGSFEEKSNFSYYAREEEIGKYILNATYYDEAGDHHSDSFDMTSDEMEELRAIFGKYGYDELVGEKRTPSVGDDADGGAATYYFSAKYADGASFSTDSAGEGASELVSFFKKIVKTHS